MRSETLCKNVEMHILETGKFKDVILSFRFFNELKTPDSWVRTVLALMLADRCEISDKTGGFLLPGRAVRRQCFSADDDLRSRTDSGIPR